MDERIGGAAVTRFVGLLRGVNVGGVKVAMADLRAAAESLGHTEVATYVNSGNVVFSAAGKPTTASLVSDLRAAIAERAGVGPAVIVLGADEWDELVADNPYPEETDGTKLHAVIGQKPFSAAQVAAAEEVRDAVRETGSKDDLKVVRNVLYMHLPDGMGRSKLAEKLGRTKAAGQHEATARNWRTVLALQERLRG